MAEGFGVPFANLIIDHIFGGAAYTQEANLYVALSKSTIDSADTGSTIPGEIATGSYARKGCNTWDAAAAGATENTQPVTFAQATADWGVITDFAVCSHSTTGDMIIFGKLNTTKNVQSGDTPRFATGDLDFTLANT